MLTAAPPGAAVDPVPARPAAGRRPRVLYLIHRFPYPPDKGDRIRSWHVLKTLGRTADVSVVTFADEPPAAEHRRTLAAACERLEVIPTSRAGRSARAGWGLLGGRSATEGAFASPAFAAAVRRVAADRRPDAVLLSCGGLGRSLDDPALRGVPAVADFVDLDSLKWADYAAASRGPAALLYRTEARRLRAAERALLDRCEAGVFVTAAEAALGRESLGAGDGKVRAVTNGVDLDYFRPAPASAAVPGRVAFLGAMDYRPNVDAAIWFCDRVWPAVRDRVPGATLELVGRRPVAAVRRLAGADGVTATGTVPDVRPHLAAAAVSVAPLRIARGLQNKVLEAMAAGRPVVASGGAAEGLDAGHGRDLLVADEPAAWADAVAGLLGDDARRAELGAAARRYVERHHDWDTCLAPLAALLGVTRR